MPNFIPRLGALDEPGSTFAIIPSASRAGSPSNSASSKPMSNESARHTAGAMQIGCFAERGREGRRLSRYGTCISSHRCIVTATACPMSHESQSESLTAAGHGIASLHTRMQPRARSPLPRAYPADNCRCHTGWNNRERRPQIGSPSHYRVRCERPPGLARGQLPPPSRPFCTSAPRHQSGSHAAAAARGVPQGGGRARKLS